MKNFTHALFIISVLGFALSTSATAGQPGKENVSHEPIPALLPNNLGTSAGTVSGVGLSYRKWFANGYGFQVAGFPYIKRSPNENSNDLNLGVLALKSFFNTENTPFSKTGLFSANIFGYAGGSGWYSSDEWNYTDPISGRYDSQTFSESTRYALGSGFGTEFGIWRVKWSLMAGIGAHFKEEKFSRAEPVQDSFELIPSVETSLYFGF